MAFRITDLKPLQRVVSKTSAYTATQSDDVILCSGSAFTVTLYTAVGNTGRQLTIKKTDSSLSNVITIDGDGSETIDGVTSTTLNTQYESVTLVSDGANWQIVERRIPSSFTSVTPTGTWVSNATYSGLVKRNGDVAEFQVLVSLTGAPTATGLTITLPSGYVIDTAKLKIGADSVCYLISSGNARDASSSSYPIFARYGSTTTVILNTIDAAATSARGGGLSETVPFTFGNGDSVQIQFEVPISGWNG